MKQAGKPRRKKDERKVYLRIFHLSLQVWAPICVWDFIMNGRAEGSMRIVSIMGQTCSTCVSYCTVSTAKCQVFRASKSLVLILFYPQKVKPISLREQAHNWTNELQLCFACVTRRLNLQQTRAKYRPGVTKSWKWSTYKHFLSHFAIKEDTIKT